jgi:hypothetical protein
MLTFKQFIAEGRNALQKGWIHKTGKSLITRGMRPYHVETFVNNLSKFGVKESDIMNILVKRYDGWDAPDPEEDAKAELGYLRSGRSDVDKELEYLAMKKGWCRVVLDDVSSIGGMNMKSIYDVAKVIDKKFPSVVNNMRFMELIPYTRTGNRGKGEVDIEDTHIWREWIKKGGDPKKIGQGRSDIGRTMAQFR